MRHFTACTNTDQYYAAALREGYATKQRGGGTGKVIQHIKVLHVSVLRGPSKAPRIVVAWLNVHDTDMHLFSSRPFASEEELQQWLDQWEIRMSRHRRPLALKD